MKQNRHFYFFVFISGFVSLGLEMVISRMLAPFFGTTIIVWACIISTVLLFICLGSIAGGRVSDGGGEKRLFALFAVSSLLISGATVLPYVALKFLYRSGYQPFPLQALFFPVSLLLMSLPVFVTSFILPIATRSLGGNTEKGGHIIGLVYGMNTLGGILGAVLTVLLLLPLAGLYAAIVFLSLLLLACGAVSWFTCPPIASRKRLLAITVAALLLNVAILAFHGQISPLVDEPGLVMEKESAYNLIRVYDRLEYLSVTVNDNRFIQSIKYKDDRFRGDLWDMYLCGPLLAGEPAGQEILIVGFGSGSAAYRFGKNFPGCRITGIELDPEMVETGKDVISPEIANATIITGDGRQALYALDTAYDMILCDAFQFPYIPNHLCTAQFYSLLKRKLKPDGLLLLNIGRYDQDRMLADSVMETLCRLFQAVTGLDVGRFNTLVFASDKGLSWNEQAVPYPAVNGAIRYYNKFSRPYVSRSGVPILSDDNTYSEWLTHAMGLKYIENGQ